MIRKAAISWIMTAVGLLIRFPNTLLESLLEDSQELVSLLLSALLVLLLLNF